VLIQAEVENCITELIHQIEKQSDIYTITTNATVPHSHCTEDNKKTKKAEDDTTHLCAHDPKPHGFPLVNKQNERVAFGQPLSVEHVYHLQTDNARNNMWGRRTNVTPPKPKLWTIKTTETRHLGVIKFYTGTDKKNRNRIPWGFLTPLEPEELEGITGDVHFTKWAFNNIPEEAVKRELVVHFSIIAGTNT